MPNVVEVMSTVEQARTYLRRQFPFEHAPRPDVVFLDLGLPGEPGTALLEMMMDDASLKDIPVVVLTGRNDPESIAEVYRLHAKCFLPKPVDLTLFLEAMSSMEGFFGDLES